MLWPVSMGFVAAIGLGIGALLLLDRGDRRGAVLAAVMLLAGLVCCEFAAFFALGVVVETLHRDRGIRRVWIGAIPLALYALWWVAYQGPTGAGQDLAAAPGFAVNLAASGVQGLLGLYIVPRLALLVAVLLVLGWNLARARFAISPRTAGLLTTMGAFWAAVALARAHMASSDATRYVYTSAILLVLLVAEVSRGASSGPRALGLGAVFAAFAVHGNLGCCMQPRARCGQPHSRFPQSSERSRSPATPRRPGSWSIRATPRS